MEDDNIIPYRTSPTLTVKQAVMYILGYRGDFYYETEEGVFEYDLYDFIRDMQEDADSELGNAKYDLLELREAVDTDANAIEAAQVRVMTAKAALEKAQSLKDIADDYRLLIDHEIKRARLGKRTPLVVDEDETTESGQLRINRASYLEWLEGMELYDANDAPVPIALPVDEDAFDKKLDRKSAVSLHVTLGLLVSLFAESSGNEFGSGQKPKVINIAKKIDEYATQLNDGYPLDWQQTQAIRKRIELALSAMKSSI